MVKLFLGNGITTGLKDHKGCMAALFLLAVGWSPLGWGANWLILQGTEPASVPAGPRFSGFVQADYQRDLSPASPAGTYIPPKLIGPELNSQSDFTMRRIRLALRGRTTAEQPNINYFVAGEFGDNAITHPEGHPQLVDASMTLALGSHHWMRAGLFKTPGVEEGMQAIHVADYINLTTVTNQLMLERPPNDRYLDNIAPLDININDHALNAFEHPAAGFRDVGIEWFGVHLVGGWEHSYALMVGQGNGVSLADDDGHKDLYLYVSSEKVGAGKGGRRQGLKLFGWQQRGKRMFDGDNDGQEENHTRNRYGVGTVWRNQSWRMSAEYLYGQGMIFLGPDKPGFDMNGLPQAGGSGLNGRGAGGYIEGGWYIRDTPWELDLRLDQYDRLKGDLLETQFQTVTAGVQYHFNQQSHITLNLADNKFNAIHYAPDAGPNAHLNSVGKRWGLSLFSAF